MAANHVHNWPEWVELVKMHTSWTHSGHLRREIKARLLASGPKIGDY